MKAPSLTTYEYGSARVPGEGLRIGVAHYVPRGVRREDWSSKGFFDYWLPLLSPDADMVAKYRHGKIPFSQFARAYRSRMKERERAQVIELLGGIATQTPLSIGCFCEDESKCHRSILKELILKAAKDHSPMPKPHCAMHEITRYSSPVCYADWETE